MKLARLAKQLRRQEGFRRFPYKDTENITSIGFGRNLESIGISRTEAKFMLSTDISRAEAECKKRLLFFPDLDDTRQEVVVNMMLNMGWGKLKTFKRMLAALEDKDFEMAAAEALDSKWHRQVKGRAVELAQQMREGEPETEEEI